MTTTTATKPPWLPSRRRRAEPLAQRPSSNSAGHRHVEGRPCRPPLRRCTGPPGAGARRRPLRARWQPVTVLVAAVKEWCKTFMLAITPRQLPRALATQHKTYKPSHKPENKTHKTPHKTAQERFIRDWLSAAHRRLRSPLAARAARAAPLVVRQLALRWHSDRGRPVEADLLTSSVISANPAPAAIVFIVSHHCNYHL